MSEEEIKKELKKEIETNNLRFTQIQQTIEQYRSNIFNLELRSNLLTKMMEEKGLFAKDEFQKRWPLYLRNDVGVPGPNGIMDGEPKITFYGKRSRS
jgi:hypothetical protein